MAAGLPIDATLADIGAQRSRTSSQSYRLVATLSGTLANWDLQASAGLTRVTTKLGMSNFVSLPALQAAVTAGTYVVGATNPTSVIAQITPYQTSTSTNDLNFVNVRATRELK